MRKLRIITVVLLLTLTGVTYADELGDIKASFANIQTLIKNYEANLKNLQAENEALKKNILDLEAKINSIPHPNPLPKGEGVSSSSGSKVITQTGIIQKASSVEKYNQIIDKINNLSAEIFSKNNLSASSTIGLFEFIEPDAFFISIDDGLNPAGVTAFRAKILYKYDKDLNLTVVGIFSLDYKSGYYITKFGKNPYAKSIRIRVKNPNYKGKLFEVLQNTNSSNATTTTQAPAINNTKPTITQNVTFDMVKDAYVNNKILDMLKLSNEYIKVDSNNIDVLRMRYRGFHMLGKYSDALVEIQKIQEIQGSNMTKVVACDGSIIAKLAKNNDLAKTYQDICKAQ